jgi:hypothetical protein
MCVAAASGRRLLLEETTSLTSPLESLSTYYRMVAEMQAYYGQTLTIGVELGAMARKVPECHVTETQKALYLPAATMAELHSMNIATWKRDPFMSERYATSKLEDLERRLCQIAAGGDELPPVETVMAQVVVERILGR